MRFGLTFKDLFVVFVQVQPRDDPLGWAMPSLTALLQRDGPFLSVNLDDFASLLTFVVPHTTRTSSPFQRGMNPMPYFGLSSSERGEDVIFLWMWEGALKCHSRFLLLSEVTKGLSFILAAGAWAMAVQGKSKVYCLFPLSSGVGPLQFGDSDWRKRPCLGHAAFMDNRTMECF